MSLLTFGALRRDPGQLRGLNGRDVLVAAAHGGEVVMDRAGAASPASTPENATAVFMHETIALMQAERAAHLEHLRRVVDLASAVLPLQRRPESFWANVTLGRASTADLTLDDPAVSNVHAEAVLDDELGTWSLQDVGSSNGTFINRQRLQPHQPQPLRTGDCVRLGQTVLYFINAGTLAIMLEG